MKWILLIWTLSVSLPVYGQQDAVRLEIAHRENNNAVRRARYALKKARKAAVPEDTARATARLERAKKRRAKSARQLKLALRDAPGDSPYRALKEKIRADLNAARRVRRARKRALRESNAEKAEQAQERLRKIKKRLRRNRRKLKRLLSGRPIARETEADSNPATPRAIR
jgi:hypothetical protein